MSKIALGGDHAGFEYKTAIIDYLNANGHITKDFGPYSLASVDYPDFVHPVANGVEVGDFDFGIPENVEIISQKATEYSKKFGVKIEFRNSYFFEQNPDQGLKLNR